MSNYNALNSFFQLCSIIVQPVYFTNILIPQKKTNVAYIISLLQIMTNNRSQ